MLKVILINDRCRILLKTCLHDTYIYTYLNYNYGMLISACKSLSSNNESAILKLSFHIVNRALESFCYQRNKLRHVLKLMN